ncbi:hypothetical protein, partial [Mesorhizobium sp. M7A.F.Ca.CA.004.02.1.1]|uniref:hypothetical protein n=1 Tax=Mesorhizobium sp. M7A.F.Ca.CA.004.02.1.1 TaxID=2496690 RepID=UPI0019D0312C
HGVQLFFRGLGFFGQLRRWVGQARRQVLELASSQARAGRPASATRMAKNIPNRLTSRQTMVKRRASIGSVSFNTPENALMQLNRL